MEENDIAMAIRLDDLAILESVFHTEAPLGDSQPDSRLLITNPNATFSFDVKSRRTVLRSLVSIQYGLFVPSSPDASAGNGVEGSELLHFALLAGAVVSVPVMGGAVKTGGRHMAGSSGQTDDSVRDKKMEHAMRVEAIKAAYGFASSQLSGLSSMSPLGRIMLPLIDADELLVSIERDEGASGNSAGTAEGGF